MKFTNKANLPQGIYNAIVNNIYDKGDARYSVSNLIQPPQILRLIQLHGEEIEIDIADEIFALLGSATHYILQQGSEGSLQKRYDFRLSQIKDIAHYIEDCLARHVPIEVYNIQDIIKRQESKPGTSMTEERLFASIGNIRVSGAMDWYEWLLKEVEDYKVTSVWKILKKDYEDYTAQLNCYKWLLNENGYEVNSLQINAILKDWKRFEAHGNNEDYPKIPVVKLAIPIWNDLDTVQFILDRVKLHEKARQIDDPVVLASALPCSEKERWHQPDKFAIMKPGGKRASFIYDTKEEAFDYIANNEGYIIEPRLGQDTRCEEFCLAKPFCNQYKLAHTTEIIIPENTFEIPDLAEKAWTETPATSITAEDKDYEVVNLTDSIKVIDKIDLVEVAPGEHEIGKISFKDIEKSIEEYPIELKEDSPEQAAKDLLAAMFNNPSIDKVLSELPEAPIGAEVNIVTDNEVKIEEPTSYEESVQKHRERAYESTDNYNTAQAKEIKAEDNIDDILKDLGL